MFSSRTNWHRQRNRLSLLLDERHRSGKPVIDLTLSNPTEAGFEYPTTEILSALSQDSSLHYTPDPLGMPSAREAVTSYYAGRGITVAPSAIVLTASTSEAYSFLFTLLCEAGDSVLVPVPSYPLFEYLAQLNDVRVSNYHLGYDGEWHIDLDSVRRAVSPATKAIVVVSPHNPTGMFLKKDELQSLNNIARQHHLALIVDEVFADYGFGEDDRRVGSTAANSEVLTFTLNGISKSCGFPQLKLGWIVVSGRDEVKTEALHRLEIISDTFLSVNTPVQVGLPKLLSAGKKVGEQIVLRIEQNLTFLKQSLPANPLISLLSTEGGWYAILRIPTTKSEEEWALELLEESGVYVFPGYFFEFQQEGYLVLSLLQRRDEFEEGVKVILKTIT
ncbi:MAG: pyridoxal phosphate-dependent aminotransferase [Bacteroidetes bacterium]|nr:pyridoxal phosphate-dependent aminotransferase [Bacteroidota bacterium]MCW5895890.1 pyridoxal phosphate-dependent aminotransferase [Bacteroidota bacterium]